MDTGRERGSSIPAALLAACCITAVAPTLAQSEPPVADHWQYAAAVYLWGAGIGGKTVRGTEVEVGFDDVLDNLELAFMAAFEARKAEWSMTAGVIYLALENTRAADLSIPVGPVRVPVTSEVDLELDGLVVHMIGGYNLYSQDKSWLDVTFGARYLDLDVDMLLELQSLGPGQSRTVSDSLTSLDAVVGLRGNMALSDRWSLPYYADIGAGESEFTWQASAGVLYKASGAVDVALLYRHLEWDIDDSARLVDDLDFSGPLLGVVFRW